MNFIFRSICVVMLALCAAFPLRAATGVSVTLPQPGTKIKSGLTLTLTLRGIDANGYRPVQIEVRPIVGTPLPADRQLRLKVWPRSYTSQDTPEVTQIIELPEGSTSVSTTLAIPQSGLWHSCRLEVYEEGEMLEDLSSVGLGFPGTNYWDWTEARPAVLVIDGNVPARQLRESLVADFKFRGLDASPTYKLPEIRLLTDLFPDPNRPGTFFPGQQISDATLLSQIVDLPRLEMLPPGELPERWIELSQYDLAIIPLVDLKSLAKNHPRRFGALSDWAAGGPLLIVTGVGDDFAGLAEIDRLLNLVPLAIDEADGTRFRGWQPAPLDKHRSVLTSELENLAELELTGADTNATWTGQWATRVQQYPGYQPGQSVDDLLPAPEKVPFAVRANVLGKIVAIASDKPFPGKDTDWIWVFNSVPRNHWMWYQRNGFSLNRANNDYWKFLIPGVGEAPVISFLLLVSLFAVLIGPVNYLILGRARRLYLLLLTVPLGAVLVTASLFTYALLTDGMGVRMRARSFTDLDQTTGRAIAWSRQSYYASIAPSRGLTFPDDATVFPIRYQASRHGGEREPERELAWDEAQHLTKGYVSSRTAMQFMVLRATESPGKLEVREAQTDRPPQVTNKLQTDVRLLVLRDRRGNYWLGENVAQDAIGTLAPVTENEAGERLRKLAGEHPLDFPRGYDPNLHHNNALSLFLPNYSWYNVDTGSSLPVMSSSLLESNVKQACRPAAFPWLPGSYVAVTETSSVIPYGVSNVSEEASLHLIRGRY